MHLLLISCNPSLAALPCLPAHPACLLQASGPMRTLAKADEDDFGSAFKRGDKVIEG